MVERAANGMKIFRPDGNVLGAFMLSKSPVKIIQGPIGSGKSLACAMVIYLKACQQVKQEDGLRYCRAHVFRDTYGKLEETTIKTWLDWFPEKEYGKFYRSRPYRHEIRVHDLVLDVSFVALEDAWSADFFKSLETTICWFNELQFIDRVLFDEAVTRVGRYPRAIDGGAVGPQVIGDMNAPGEDHWVPIMRGDVAPPDWYTVEQRRAVKKPATWEFFVQPPGLIEEKDGEGEVAGYKPNPKAENTKFLPGGYYLNAAQGKSKSWIDANILNRVSPRRDGKPVFSDFNRAVHVAKKPFDPIPNVDIIVGCDFGRRPCAIFGQNVRGVWYILHELISRDMGAAEFAPLLSNEIAQRFPDHRFRLWGDPSGDFKGQNDNQTPFKILRSRNLPIIEAPGGNLLTVRLQAVEAVLTRMQEGKPSILFSPSCTTLIAAMDGGYHFKRMKVSGERYHETPEKDEYSDPADALQYLLLGGGEGRKLLSGSEGTAKPIQTKRPFNPFETRRPMQAARLRGW
jgi:hypothetical protein